MPESGHGPWGEGDMLTMALEAIPVRDRLYGSGDDTLGRGQRGIRLRFKDRDNQRNTIISRPYTCCSGTQ